MTRIARATSVAQVITTLRLLRERPHRTEEIAEALAVPRRTVERLLVALRAAGVEIESERIGQREVAHSLTRAARERVIP